MNTMKKSPAAQTSKNVPKKKRVRRRKNNGNGNGGNPDTTNGNRSSSSYAGTGMSISYAKPQKSNNGRDTIVISRSECLGDVAGATDAFKVYRSLNINPGLKESFPLLSEQATQYQYYRFRSLHYRFVPTCAVTHNGLVIMVPEYNNSDVPPTSTAGACNNEDYVSFAPYVKATMVMRPSRMFCQGPKKLIRNGCVASDVNLYDAGIFYLITSSLNNTTNIGQLFVDYVVEFSSPQTSLNNIALPSRINYYMLSAGQAINENTTTVVGFDLALWNPLKFVAPVAGNFILPPGAFKVEAMVCSHNTVSEFSEQILTIYRNGTRIGAQCITDASRTTALGTSYCHLYTSSVFISNGNDSCEVKFYYSDTASNTIALVANSCFLTFQCV